MTRLARLRVAALAAGLILGMCHCSQDDTLPLAPSDCQTSKPDLGNLNIQVTIDAQNTRVPVAIYVGHIEDGMLLQRDSLTVSSVDYSFPVDKAYTVTATYLVGQDTILAIAQDEIQTHETEYQNSTHCWDLINAAVDVRLKR